MPEKIDVKTGRPIFYFFLSSLIIAVTACYVHRAFFVGEPVQEVATIEYYYVYYHKGLLDIAFHSSGFYLEWLPYAIVYLCVHVLGLKQDVFYAIQFTSLLFLLLFSTFICLAPFRKLIRSDFTRFMVAIFIGFFYVISSAEYLRVTDLAYPGVLFVFLMMFFVGTVRSLWLLIPLSLISGLTICSKTYFIVFLPFYALLLWHHGRTRGYRAALFCLVPCLFLATCLAKTLLSTAAGGGGAIRDTVVSVLVYWSSIYIRLLTSILRPDAWLPALGLDQGLAYREIAYGVLAMSLMLAAFFLIRGATTDRAARRLAMGVAAANAIGLVAIFVTVHTSLIPGTPAAYPTFHDFDFQVVTVPRTRHFIFADELITFTVIWAIYFFCRKRMAGVRSRTGPGFGAVLPDIAIACVLGAFMLEDIKRHECFFDTVVWSPPPRQLSDWQVFSRYLDVPGYLVPNISPIHWFPTGVTIDPQDFLTLGRGPQPLNDIGVYDLAIPKKIAALPLVSGIGFRPGKTDGWRLDGLIVYPLESYDQGSNPWTPVCGSRTGFIATNDGLRGVSLAVHDLRGLIDQRIDFTMTVVADDAAGIVGHGSQSQYYLGLERHIAFRYTAGRLISLDFPALPASAGRRFRLEIECRGPSDALFSQFQIHQRYDGVTALAYDAGGREIARAEALSSAESWYRYLKFDREIPSAGIGTIVFRDRDGNPFRLAPLIQFFGIGRTDLEALTDGSVIGRPGSPLP